MESFIYSSGYPTQIIRFKQKSQFNLDPQSEQSFKNSILNPKRPSFSSSPPMRVAGGKIIEVKGGHFVPSTSRKDQHNKICTAKGLRDRRFRLSARTAIKFYDVQDRLGYDRPSKAVDRLIKNAKASIDELAEASEKQMKPVSDPFSFLPPSLDSDAIADTIKSFFPVAQQDLRISLQSFQDPFFQQNPGDSVERGTLQSSDLISVPWMDPAELQMHPMASIEFSRFHIPARIGGEEEHKGGCCSCQR